MRRLLSSTLLLAAAACNLDKALESEIPLDARLTIGVPAEALTVPRGGDMTFNVSVTCSGQCSRQPTVKIENVSAGLTVPAISLDVTDTLKTVAMVSVKAGAETALGTYSLTVRGSAPGIADAEKTVSIAVVQPAAYALSLSRSVVTVARGGIARVNAAIQRTNFATGVTLSVAGPAGVSGAVTNPVTGDLAEITLSVASDVPAGSHTLTVRGSAAGLADRVVSLPLTVIVDAIQLIPDSAVVTPQGRAVTAEIIVNHATVPSVALTAENLPAGTSASFQAATRPSTTTVTFDVGATTPGSYPVILRGTGNGAPDATAGIVLTVTPASIAISLDPSSLRILPSTSAAATLSITRSSFSGAVAITAEGLPAGVDVAVTPASTTGSSVALTASATATAAPGDYPIVIRATPAGLPPNAKTTTLLLTVRPAPSNTGKAVLDWTGCATPVWIAVQDGTAPWTRLAPTNGTAQFAVDSARAGFAFADGSYALDVQYMTREELLAGARDLCPPKPGTKTVSGISEHAGPGETVVYRLGGGSGSSTSANPSFTITQVDTGLHDLVGWRTGSPDGVQRGLIRRDINLAHGASIGTIVWGGSGGFGTLERALTISGGPLSGEQMTLTMSYLTTPKCTRNELYTGSANPASTMGGVSPAFQRADDYHHVAVTAATSTTSRTATTTFRAMAARTVDLPQPFSSPDVSALPGAYKRLRATIATLPALYGTSVQFRYNAGLQTMTLVGSRGYLGDGGATLTMPDFSTVTGWSNQFAIASIASGGWTVTAEGSTNPGSLCVEGRTSALATRSGTH
jgi:hypothetical protein